MWDFDNDIVDHQSVIIEFEDGSTATHNMVGGSARPARNIHILGTTGEILGVFEDSKFVVRKIDPGPNRDYSEEIVDLNIQGDIDGSHGGHGGGHGSSTAGCCSSCRELFLYGGMILRCS